MKDGPDFSGSCHFLCTLFSLTFCLWPPWLHGTPHAASEKTLLHIHVLCNHLAPCTCSSFPLSFRLPLFLTSELARHPSLHHFHHCFLLSLDQVFSSPLSFLRLLTSSHPLFAPSPSSLQHVKTPASCDLLCACEQLCVWVWERASPYVHPCLSYILDRKLVSGCFTGQRHYIRHSI